LTYVRRRRRRRRRSGRSGRSSPSRLHLRRVRSAQEKLTRLETDH
jgi:hypothetical protein